jgi:hypothetical protein
LTFKEVHPLNASRETVPRQAATIPKLCKKARDLDLLIVASVKL